MQEVQQSVAGPQVIGCVHGDFSEEILVVAVFKHEGTESVPQIVQSVDALSLHVDILVVGLDERASQLNGERHIVVYELLGEAEYLTCGHLLWRYAAAEDVPVTSKYLIVVRIPDYQLAVVVHGVRVEPVYVTVLARASSGQAERYLPEPAYLLHDVGRVLVGHLIEFIVALACGTDVLGGCKLTAYELAVNGFDYRLHSWSVL